MKVGDYVRYKYEDCIYIGKIKFISEVMGFDETLQFESMQYLVEKGCNDK